MINYLDLTKLFIRSLRINKFNRKGGKVFFYTLIILSILFVFLPFMLIYTIFVYDTMNKLNDVNFANIGFEALLFLICIFSFVFSFNVLLNELYFSEDIENILPLPIKAETLAASKFSSCFIVENGILFIFLLLAVLAYVFALGLPKYYILLGIIGIIFLPMLSMIYCSLILFVIISVLKRFISSKSIKRIGYVLLGLLIVLIVYLLWKVSSFNFEQYIEEFAKGDHTFIEVMKYIFPTIHLFVIGLNDGSIIYMMLSVLLNFVYFGVMLLVARLLYYDGLIEIINKDTESKRMSSKKIKHFKVRSPFRQYMSKDIKMLFRSPTFFINCILINIIWPIFVFLIFRIGMSNYTITYMRDAIGNNNVFDMRLLLIIIGVSIIVPAFNALASSAFSREGKNYHFIKYIPMKYGVQWREKYLLSFIISFIGIMFYALPFFIIIHVPIITMIMYICLISLCISFVAFIGLLIDSAFPKIVWDDEADSLRENYNAFIAMGYSLLLFGILCGLGYYLFDHNIININQFALLSFLVLIILNILLYIISDKKIGHNIVKQEV